MKKKQIKKRDYVAILKVYDINKMSRNELNDLFRWLRDKADGIDGSSTNQYANIATFKLMK